jgi:2,4-dienoyl-CoA reductase-like NADH-dependent reductase (Old Yellow Enzyme family)
MNQVFEKISIAGIVLENRILRSATYEGMADDEGYPKSELLTIYERLARNKVGAIITGYVAVQRNGWSTRNMCLFDSNDHIDDYKN